MTADEMAAVFDARKAPCRIMGVFDAQYKQDAAFTLQSLGQAILFLSDAPMHGYDVRASNIFYGDNSTKSIASKDIQGLVATYGRRLVDE